ncbi:DUF1707 domain-containing protein [Yinghuangia sp. ASG 101]|uniref:DUF1707 SHOCT-like domain-containing protein n=1 Tax=Yinghuangia sp. ASG 101 TaxID=2896848 RepID=UPI001E597BF1|nr:DUF1707 domain-containing protein [Yinghuangia sp. ASG 101]UGQ09403.1 DUF1707 domain-containing protein [Yinghuangia sp. ASG 101]
MEQPAESAETPVPDGPEGASGVSDTAVAGGVPDPPGPRRAPEAAREGTGDTAPAPVPPPAPAPAVPPPAPARPPAPVPGIPTGPVAPADMRASDADRDRVAQVLRTAFEEGRITIDEHTERIEALYSAKTMGALEPLTFDLPGSPRPAPPKPPGTPEPASHSPYRPLPPGAAPTETPSVVAVFGGAERKGPGRIGRKLRAAAVFGGIEIDLSEATFDEPVLIVNVVSVFGGVEVRVPEGVTVRGHGAGVFGGFSVHQHVADDPDAPVVVVRGAAVFGGVDVRRKRPKPRKSPDI